MDKLTRDDLYSLEEYAKLRSDLRARAVEHKKHRKIPLGPHATVYFEDRTTMQYQVQEMLRAERIFEPEGIDDELAAYNPLIPDGSNWKATFMIEYEDVEERKTRLQELIGIEDTVWVQLGGHDKVYPIADEDMERDTGDKTSTVHFMRWELTPEMVRAVKAGASIAMGIEHENYTHVVEAVPEDVRESLAADLD